FRAVADQISIVLQNHRLLRESQVSATQLSGRVETLQTLNSIFSAANTSQDEKSLLDMIVTSLTDLLKIDHAAIMLLDPTAVTGTVVSEYPDHGAVGVQFNMLTNPLHLVMKENDFRPVVIDDVTTYPGFDEESRETLSGLGVRSMLLIAIIIQGKVVGSVGLDIYAHRRRFTADMVNIAQTVVLQAGTSLQNLRLLQDTKRRAEQLEHITEFSQVTQVVLDVNAILNHALQASTGIMFYDNLRIALYDAETAKLRVVASRVNDQIEVHLTGGEQIPISGHLATVWETRSALHIPDLYAYPRESQVDPRSRDWMVVPMIIQGRITGMVSVGSTQSHQYSQTDVTVFQQFVNQLAGAIESAQAYNQSLRQAENESLINEISTNLQRQPDIQGMLDVTVQELGKALGARQARIRLTADEPGNK
ncbi:MAG: GAF domain-containing protein, partial [Anaerolineae bacterium]|nr:GAF domain-containing protein [Anaerolineae bacterium]